VQILSVNRRSAGNVYKEVECCGKDSVIAVVQKRDGLLNDAKGDHPVDECGVVFVGDLLEENEQTRCELKVVENEQHVDIAEKLGVEQSLRRRRKNKVKTQIERMGRRDTDRTR
jgi:hypothetical protein